jgi:transcription elongation factor GreB
MSKAFTREDDDAPTIVAVRARAPLPAGSPNYVTPDGARRLADERAAIAHAVESTTGEERQAALARLSEIETRLAITEIVSLDKKPKLARLGVQITYDSELHGRRVVTLVGVDDADAARGFIAWTSPIARALSGKAKGEVVTVRTPGGEDELVIVKLSAGDA